VAERFAAGEADLTGSGRTFAVVYLVLHGLVKLGLVVALLREVRPAYPVAVGVLAAFVLYEGHRPRSGARCCCGSRRRSTSS
jgi:uncharacterized membrane protein